MLEHVQGGHRALRQPPPLGLQEGRWRTGLAQRPLGAHLAIHERVHPSLLGSSASCSSSSRPANPLSIHSSISPVLYSTIHYPPTICSPSIYPTISHPSIQFSFHPPTQRAISSSIHLFTNLYIHSFIQFIHPLNSPSTHSSSCPSTHPSMQSSIHPPIHYSPTVYPINSFIHLFTQHLSIHPPTQQSIRVFLLKTPLPGAWRLTCMMSAHWLKIFM